MTAVVRANALQIPLRDESVDLIVTSPPYFGQRSYRDADEHFDGQIGSEAHPREFLEALWAVTAECWRVLKPSGSMFVNLGDKRSGSKAPGTTSGLGGTPQGLRTGMTESPKRRDEPRASDARPSERRSKVYVQAAFGRAKSKQLLPHRYAIGCEDGAADPDGIGWIVRQDLVWSKPNGLPESVRDRTRDAHEYWFHLCKQGDYFAAIDELRGEPSGYTRPGRNGRAPVPGQRQRQLGDTCNPLGPLPRSVWEIATEPFTAPAHLSVEHFAAFPTEWPRRLILGFSASGICTSCDEPLRPIVERPGRLGGDNNPQSRDGTRARNGMDGGQSTWAARSSVPDRIVGYQCRCTASTPTRPAVVLDPFGGTGTTAMVARALGRTGISLDLGTDYCRLAQWRIFDSPGAAKVADRTARDRQGALL